MEMHRNTRCWCGSGKKYKQCHEKFDEKLAKLAREGHIVPDRSLIKNKEDIIGIKKSGNINTGVLDHVAKHIRPGMSTGEIDRLVYDYTVSHGAIPAPLNYEGFPKSCCTSVNDEVCHGIPDDSIILQEGDIVNVDVSTIFHGYYSDASRMFMIGEVSEEARNLVEVTKECLNIGMDAVKPWGHVGDIGAAIVIGFCVRFFRPRYFLRLMGAVLLAVVIGVLPMFTAALCGKPMQGSIGWGINILTGRSSSGTNQNQDSNENKANTSSSGSSQIALLDTTKEEVSQTRLGHLCRLIRTETDLLWEKVRVFWYWNP